jgi:hypothetical protein
LKEVFYNSKRYNVSGEVSVSAYDNGVETEKRVYKATGYGRGNIEKAVDNMRWNAIHKFMTEFKYGSGTKFFTHIRYYQVDNIEDTRFKTRRHKRKGRYYYSVRDKSGRFVSGGKWGSKHVDVDAYINETDTYAEEYDEEFDPEFTGSKHSF